jgi:hypothetical protein
MFRNTSIWRFSSMTFLRRSQAWWHRPSCPCAGPAALCGGMAAGHRPHLLIHCWAGISRSTAAAYMLTVCALNPDRDEEEIADTLRQAAPSATPNPRLVSLADGVLGREGRMVQAISRIGRGETAGEGTPFSLSLEKP